MGFFWELFNEAIDYHGWEIKAEELQANWEKKEVTDR